MTVIIAAANEMTNAAVKDSDPKDGGMTIESILEGVDVSETAWINPLTHAFTVHYIM